MKALKEYYKQHPLTVILAVGFLFRMVSVIFAKGYGMHDDHFLIIETSRSWASNWDFQHWIYDNPRGHSFTYPLLMFFLFKVLGVLGIENLDTQMYIVRFLHAIYSLLTIYFAYKITLKATKRQDLSNIAAWFMAIFWCMPWLSVRNLVEITCIPLLLLSTYLYIRHEQPSLKDAFLSGMIMALALAFRFQVVFFIGGFGLSMLIYRQYKQAIVWSLAIVIVFFLTQISDIFIWHKPFAELQEYVLYNFYHSSEYPQGGFFKYFGVLLGVLVPPISAFLLLGFAYGYRRLVLFLPALCFFLFHSIFPNKQERFIFPILPFIVILGIIGLNELVNKNSKSLLKKTIRVCFKISLGINAVLILPTTIHYSKSARVESMKYMSKFAPNVRSFLVENTVDKHTIKMPRTYAMQYLEQYNYIDSTANLDKKSMIEPSFVMFSSDKNLDYRVQKMRKFYPNLVYQTTIKPSLIDDLLRKINHHNRNYPIIIYRNTDVIK